MDYFSEEAANWDSNPQNVERARKTYEWMREHLPIHSGMECLEFGAGTGYLGFLLSREVKNLTLLDPAPGMIEVIESKRRASSAGNMRAVLGDLSHSGFTEGSFDLVYSVLTIHHILDTEAVARRFHHLLRKGGYFCVSELMHEDGSFHAHHDGYDGHNGFDPETLEGIFQAAGFRNVRYEIYMTMGRTIRDRQVKFPLFIMTGKK